MVNEEAIQSPMVQRQPNPPTESGQNMGSMFSPRLKSLAAMAGWDEESILMASLIVEDTPDRDFKHRRRFDFNFKTPPSNSSRRKCRAQKKSPIPISVPVISLEEEEPEKQENEREKIVVKEEAKTKEDELKKENSGVSCSNSVLPCMDKLREELSCAICLEICFEPSTTSCGHSFCKKCLRSAADKCGKKCPKCRQLISNGRSCTVNTVLWNTIQLLFPLEVEARKAAGALNGREASSQSLETRISADVRTPNFGPSWVSETSRDSALTQRPQRGEGLARILSRNASGRGRRRTSSQAEFAASAQGMQGVGLSEQLRRNALRVRRNSRRGRGNQDEDAALALRLQREEFMETFRRNEEQSGSFLSLARENLRAMASRAVNGRIRSHLR